MVSINQKGFGAVQLVLLVVLVGLIGGTGFYVYKSQKNTKNSNSASTDQTSTEQEENVSYGDDIVDINDNWLVFTSSDKAYSVRVPDGWDGVALYDNLYVRDSAKLVHKQGTKAKIELLEEGGWDGASPFALYYPKQNADQIVREGVKQGEIKTDAGLTVHKYKFVQEVEPDGIGYQKGDTVYNYYFDADGKFIQVSHVYSQGGADQSAMVEELIKTITVKI